MTGLRALIVVGTLAVSVPLAAAEVKQGETAPELDIAKDAAGKRVKLKSLRGKTVVLDFCAEWAKPVCKKLLPAHDELAGRLKGKVVFLVVMIDPEEAAGKKYARSLKLKNLRYAFASAEKSGVVEKYAYETVPMTYVLDRDGVVQYIKEGFRDGDIAELEEQLGKMP